MNMTCHNVTAVFRQFVACSSSLNCMKSNDWRQLLEMMAPHDIAVILQTQFRLVGKLEYDTESRYLLSKR